MGVAAHALPDAPDEAVQDEEASDVGVPYGEPTSDVEAVPDGAATPGVAAASGVHVVASHAAPLAEAVSSVATGFGALPRGAVDVAAAGSSATASMQPPR